MNAVSSRNAFKSDFTRCTSEVTDEKHADPTAANKTQSAGHIQRPVHGTEAQVFPNKHVQHVFCTDKYRQNENWETFMSRCVYPETQRLDNSLMWTVTSIRFLMDQRQRKTFLAEVKTEQPELPSVPDSSQLAYISSYYSEW